MGSRISWQAETENYVVIRWEDGCVCVYSAHSDETISEGSIPDDVAVELAETLAEVQS